MDSIAWALKEIINIVINSAESCTTIASNLTPRISSLTYQKELASDL